MRQLYAGQGVAMALMCSSLGLVNPESQSNKEKTKTPHYFQGLSLMIQENHVHLDYFVTKVHKHPRYNNLQLRAM